MPLYEYYCPPCATQFEVLRPMKDSDKPAVCPEGHTTNTRVLSLFAVPRSGAADESGFDVASGGCACGGACSCGAH